VNAVLQISDAQLNACGQIAEKRFVSRLLEHFCQHFPEELARLAGESEGGADPASDFVSKAIRRAARMGIDQFDDVRILLTLILANARHTQTPQESHLSWTLPILARSDLDGACKIAIIEQELLRLSTQDPFAAQLYQTLEQAKQVT
jgi:hypothetical protein